MKTILVTLLWSATAYLSPVSAAESATAETKPLVKVVKTFSFKVKSKVSSKIDGTGSTPGGVPIPPGIPKYKIGKSITFKIAKSDHLIWKDHSLAPDMYSPMTSSYSYIGTAKNRITMVEVFVNTNDKPTSVRISFYKRTKSGAHHYVNYYLE